MLRFLLIFLCISATAQAQELPEFLAFSLAKSQQYFTDYSSRALPEERQDQLAEADRTLFAQVDQINNFDLIFSKSDIRMFRLRMVLAIAQTFTLAQLKSIIEIAYREGELYRQALSHFEVALEYKTGALRESSVLPKIRSIR